MLTSGSVRVAEASTLGEEISVKATVVWKDGMTFEGRTDTGFQVTTAAPLPDGSPPSGPLPMDLVLIALGSCTGMDVAGILRKMRQPFTGLVVETVGERRAEHPKSFNHIEIRYTVRGRGLDPGQVEKAVQLSQERYCSVATMLRSAVQLTYAWNIEEDAPDRVRKTA
jgi:putative redox protein